MEALQPVINLLVLLTALSLIAERLTDVLKHRRPDLCDRHSDTGDGDSRVRSPAKQLREDRRRASAIQARCLGVGVLVAAIAKADMFAILADLSEPWRSLGWVRMAGTQWFTSPALSSAGSVAYALVGCVLTGVALGFGSKFWHDVLGTVYELRSVARNRGSEKVLTRAVGAAPAGTNGQEPGEVADA